MSDSIKPALTPEEWEDLLSDPEQVEDAIIEISAKLEYRPQPYFRHMLAALCLYGQPFGFTRERLASLRAVIGMAEQTVLNRANVYPAALQQIFDAKADADRIESLLPPEK